MHPSYCPRRKAKTYFASMFSFSSIVLFSFFQTTVVGTQPFSESSVIHREAQECRPANNVFSAAKHKDLYTVGVLAIRGAEAAYREFNSTFSDYLTATAGSSFDSPIRFQMKPLNFRTLFTDTEASEVDFIYVNPSAYSCIESEFGAHSLVSQISLRKVGGQSFDLTQFGGVIFARADSEIFKVQDIKDKSVACASISGLGSGQMQFRLLQQNGLSYINDPKQMVFTSNQGKVVNGVLNGQFDVGYVRTDQIERTKGADGNIIDASKLRILEPKPGLNIDGIPFPFQSSTQLYAEWNVAALTHVPADVAKELQSAMLGLADHALVGSQINACYEEKLCNTNTSAFLTEEACKEACHTEISLTDLRCDTNVDIALRANSAKTEGRYTGWRTTISYMELRNMQEETGFISKNSDTGEMQCIRSSNIYEDIVCPPGHFKKSEEDVTTGCTSLGLPCDEGFQCVCKPCVRAFDVDVSPLDAIGSGCSKMQICGNVEQTKIITFKAVDNKQREDATMFITLHEAQTSRNIDAIRDPQNPFMYTFNVSAAQKGSVVMEILVDDEQIPESPLRVTVETRDCQADTGDSNSIADQDGACVCIASAVAIGGSCVRFSTLLPSFIVPLMIFAFLGVYAYVERKKKQADSVWAVKTEELLFDNPVEVIGRGTFGLVLLGEYRGTQVAVKRVIPPRLKDKKIRKNDMLGSGELKPLEDEGPPVMAQTRRSSLTNGAVFDLENGTRQPLGIRSSDIDKDQSVFFGLKSGALWSQGATSQESRSGSFKNSIPTFVGKVLRFKMDDYTRLKRDFMTEMRHLSKLRHPCITTVMGAVIDKREEPMLVMEYMDHGSLYDLLHNQTLEIEGEIVLPILRDIAQGVRFLHAADPKVIHGDIKAQNILVDSKFRAKVADFGLSQKKQIGATGTPLWMAPELLRGESENTAMSDVYSFGIILYEVYSRKDPFYGENHREVLKLVADPMINKRPPVPPACPDAVASIMTECLDKTPGSRPTFEQLDLRLKNLDVENVEPGKMSFSMQEKKLKQAERSEELLFDVFPKHIAEAIRDGRKVDPESREAVTIFFSDIVGFTDISSQLTALEVSDMLDRLYIRFDECSRKHDIFKVETIGDAYMAVTNLVKDQPDHTAKIANFAIDALRIANETLILKDDPDRGYVNIRVGFHSGPVVANVVGTRNPRYCLFGDTVNTASRMESNSMANRIQCSDRSYYFLRRQDPLLPVRPRGKIHIKGKGEMRTFWINEERTPSCSGSVSSTGSTESGHSAMKLKKKRPGLNTLSTLGEH